MKKIVSIIYFFTVTFSLIAQVTPNLYKTTEVRRMDQWVDSVFSTMTLDEKIGQLFMIVVDPDPKPANSQLIVKRIKTMAAGGVLFSKGTVSDQVASTNLYQKESRIPLLISLDGEWGLSMRLENTTRFPKNMMLGAISNEKSIELYGEEVARQCKEMGIQINFAPVLDVNNNPSNPVIGTRSFGENPERVMLHGNAYARGLERRGVMAVCKHFPGHGDTADDSHFTTPYVSHDVETLEKIDLYPFRSYVNEGFSGLMTGHLSVPSLDPSSQLPTSLSANIVSGLIKKDLGFSGLLFTDALVMKGASSKENVCVQALLAGNDVLLSPGKPVEDFAAVKKAVSDGKITLQSIEERCKKILQYKYILGLKNYRPVVSKEIDNRLNTDSAEWICRRLNNESMTLVKNENQILPLKAFENNRIAVLSLGDEKSNDFQKMLAKYDDVDMYSIETSTKTADMDAIFKQLNNYDVIICGIHSAKMDENASFKKLVANKNTILCFFITPYSMTSFKQSIKSARSVLVAYENTKYAQQAAAQAVMGGIPVTGKLPVSVVGLFDEGEGITTEKVRLAYQLPLEVGMSPKKLKAINEIVREGIKEKAFPGCQVLVAKDGVVIYDQSFGYFDYANTHAVQTDDMYDLASVTKVMSTLLAVMKLYDQKKINLSDLLSKYIPELKKSDKEKITIKEALFHESGLTSFLPFYQMTIDKTSYEGRLFSTKRDLTFRILYDDNAYGRTDFEFLPDLVSETSKEPYTLQVADHFYLNESFQSLILKDIVDSNLKKKGTYLYSDLNFMLLKEAVEAISETSIDRYLDQYYYRRLGADYTMYQPLKHQVDIKSIAPTEDDKFLRNQILIGYVHDEAAAFMGGVSGNAGLFSNVNDLAKISQMFLNRGSYGGEIYFKESTADLFTKTQSSNSRRGLGFDRPDTAKKPDYLPASVYGHTGFTGTSIWIDPENQLTYIFLSNRIYPSRTYKNLSKLHIRERIQEVIYGAMEK